MPQVYVRDCTSVGPYPLMLFGGRVHLDSTTVHGKGAQKKEEIMVGDDRWIRFVCTTNVAALIGKVRGELDKLLRRKITQPRMEFGANAGQLIEAVIQLLSTQ